MKSNRACVCSYLRPFARYPWFSRRYLNPWLQPCMHRLPRPHLRNIWFCPPYLVCKSLTCFALSLYKGLLQKCKEVGAEGYIQLSTMMTSPPAVSPILLSRYSVKESLEPTVTWLPNRMHLCRKVRVAVVVVVVIWSGDDGLAGVGGRTVMYYCCLLLYVFGV